MRSGIPNFTEEPAQRQIARACQQKPLMPKSRAMTRLATYFGAFVFVLWVCSSAFAQTFARSPAAPTPAEAGQLEALSKKIDEQNAKIDTLSQQILKLEQQISNLR